MSKIIIKNNLPIYLLVDRQSQIYKQKGNKMKIYDVEGFPNPARVRIALAEKGVSDQVDFINVDVMGGEHRTDAFKAKNPDAVVPVLELSDGTHIAQCTAITEYIDGAFEGISLIGETPAERAKTHMTVSYTHLTLPTICSV